MQYENLHEQLLTLQEALQDSSSQVPPALPHQEAPLPLQNHGSSSNIAPSNEGVSNVSSHQGSIALAATPKP